MSDSWLSPKLLEKIADNVPFLQRALLALVKQDPSSIADVPTGAKRLVEISKGMWQLQQFNGTSWEPLGKLQMDVDTLDTFNAALTPQKNTIPVRDANGDLPGNITGNAATADSAKTLSEILEVEKGGTGASTPEQGRINMGVPPTSHASSSPTYGLGNNLNYGHMRGDGITTNGVNGEVVVKNVAINGVQEDTAGGRGQIGSPVSLPAGTDANDILRAGHYQFNAGCLNLPSSDAYFVDVYDRIASATNRFCVQVARRIGGKSNQFSRYFNKNTDTWSDWVEFITSKNLASASTPGIMQPGDGLASDNNGRISVDDTVLRNTGNQIIGGNKTFTNGLLLQNAFPRIDIIQTDFEKGVVPDTAQYANVLFFDKNGNTDYKNRTGVLENSIDASGTISTYLKAFKNQSGNQTSGQLGVGIKMSGDVFTICPNPKDGSNTNEIATTKWVRDHHVISTTVPTSDQGTDGDIWYRY